MAKILINSMKFSANLGHYDNERIAGTNISIDLVLWTDISKAEQSDKIKDALNYQEVYNLVKEIVTTGSFKLLERMANEIIKILFKNFNKIEKIKICIIKTNPQMGGEIGSVGIEINDVRAAILKGNRRPNRLK